MIVALLLVGVLVGAVFWLFYAGVGVWGIDWPVVWGFAIINYVWWIAIASGGTFISALFYLARVEWRTSLNRIAETMTIFAAACAGIFPILHLGRPWLFYWLFPFPNTMTLWPQFRSPLLWDFFAILAYVVSSVLFWYFGLIPDLATMRDRATNAPQADHLRRDGSRISRVGPPVAPLSGHLWRLGGNHGAVGHIRA